jgi:hypothetical protein
MTDDNTLTNKIYTKSCDKSFSVSYVTSHFQMMWWRTETNYYGSSLVNDKHKPCNNDLIFGIFTPLSAIFQLHHGDQF